MRCCDCDNEAISNMVQMCDKCLKNAGVKIIDDKCTKDEEVKDGR